MNIDWSKAPEGVTHKDTEHPDGFWYKFDFENNTAAYCSPHQTTWTESGKATDYNDGSMDFMVSMSDPDKVVIYTAEQIEEQEAEKLERFLIANRGLENNEYFLAKLLYRAGYRKVQA